MLATRPASSVPEPLRLVAGRYDVPIRDALAAARSDDRGFGRAWWRAARRPRSRGLDPKTRCRAGERARSLVLRGSHASPGAVFDPLSRLRSSAVPHPRSRGDASVRGRKSDDRRRSARPTFGRRPRRRTEFPRARARPRVRPPRPFPSAARARRSPGIAARDRRAREPAASGAFAVIRAGRTAAAERRAFARCATRWAIWRAFGGTGTIAEAGERSIAPVRAPVASGIRFAR